MATAVSFLVYKGERSRLANSGLQSRTRYGVFTLENPFTGRITFL
jgi:hypothetical protein